MRSRRAALLCLMLLFDNHGFRAEATSADDAAARCQALASIDFTRVLDAPTQIAEAAVIDARGDNPAYCRCGVTCGRRWVSSSGCRSPLGTASSSKPAAAARAEIPDGCFCAYACVASDMGHQSTGQDLSWAYQQLQAQIDVDIRGPHVVAPARQGNHGTFLRQPARTRLFHGMLHRRQAGAGRSAAIPLGLRRDHRSRRGAQFFRGQHGIHLGRAGAPRQGRKVLAHPLGPRAGPQHCARALRPRRRRQGRYHRRPVSL